MEILTIIDMVMNTLSGWLWQMERAIGRENTLKLLLLVFPLSMQQLWYMFYVPWRKDVRLRRVRRRIPE